MGRISGTVMAVVMLAAVAGCASQQKVATVEPVMVPPRIDLKQHEMIGIIEFSSSSRGQLGTLATRRFTEAARRDQGLVRIVEVQAAAGAARSASSGRLDAEAFKALGREHGVKTIVTGQLTVSAVRPSIQVSALWRSGQASAQVDATLEVQMIETATGASIWSGSGSATRTVGNVSVFGGRDFTFDADDPEKAYGDLVDSLVAQVTRDFQATWERR